MKKLLAFLLVTSCFIMGVKECKAPDISIEEPASPKADVATAKNPTDISSADIAEIATTASSQAVKSSSDAQKSQLASASADRAVSSGASLDIAADAGASLDSSSVATSGISRIISQNSSDLLYNVNAASDAKSLPDTITGIVSNMKKQLANAQAIRKEYDLDALRAQDISNIMQSLNSFLGTQAKSPADLQASISDIQTRMSNMSVLEVSGKTKKLINDLLAKITSPAITINRDNFKDVKAALQPLFKELVNQALNLGFQADMYNTFVSKTGTGPSQLNQMLSAKQSDLAYSNPLQTGKSSGSTASSSTSASSKSSSSSGSGFFSSISRWFGSSSQ